MGRGLQCFDSRGWLTFQATDHLPRILGSYNTAGPGITGSTTDSNLANGEGTPFVLFIQTNGGYAPKVYISGTTIYWDFPAVPPGVGNPNAGGYIVWGLQ